MSSSSRVQHDSDSSIDCFPHSAAKHERRSSVFAFLFSWPLLVIAHVRSLPTGHHACRSTSLPGSTTLTSLSCSHVAYRVLVAASQAHGCNVSGCCHNFQHVLLSPLPQFLPLPLFHELFPPRCASCHLCSSGVDLFPTSYCLYCSTVDSLQCEVHDSLVSVSRTFAVICLIVGTVDTFSIMMFSKEMRSSSYFKCRSSAESAFQQTL